MVVGPDKHHLLDIIILTREAMKVAGKTWQRSRRTSLAAGSYIHPWCFIEKKQHVPFSGSMLNLLEEATFVYNLHMNAIVLGITCFSYTCR